MSQAEARLGRAVGLALLVGAFAACGPPALRIIDFPEPSDHEVRIGFSCVGTGCQLPVEPDPLGGVRPGDRVTWIADSDEIVEVEIDFGDKGPAQARSVVSSDGRATARIRLSAGAREYKYAIAARVIRGNQEILVVYDPKLIVVHD